MRSWLAIVNPGAGALQHGDFRSHWLPQVMPHVAAVRYTQTPGQATEIARNAATYDGIVIIGGDGTIFEVLAGLGDGDQPLALIPAGRGNSLALDLGVGEIPVAIDALENGQAVCIDLLELEMCFADGRRHTCRAASTVAIGYVADVVRLAGRFVPLGGYAYTLAAVCTCPRRFPIVADYGAGQRYTGKVTGVVINNTRHLANFLAFPKSSLADGLVDVLELHAGWAGQLVHNLSVLSHRYFYQPGREFRTSQVRLRLAVPDTLMVDGELFTNIAELSVSCRPGAVRVHHAGTGVC